MRGVNEQPISLSKGFPDQPELAVLEISEPSVNDSRGGGTGAGAEIGFLHQKHIHIFQCQFTKQASAINSAAHDEHRNLRLESKRRKSFFSGHSVTDPEAGG